MRAIWIIAKRELNSYFDSLIAYMLLVAFLGITGLFTWLIISDVFLVNQASLRSFFAIAPWTLVFFIPALTMRLFAEEKKTGTIELLLTKAVSDWEVVLGKFLSCFILIAITLAFTLPYYITVWNLGPIDHGAVWSGYLGLLLLSGCYISIGLFTSSITNNQIVAFLMAMFIGLFFHILFDFIAFNFKGMLGQLLSYLSITSHYDSMSRGVIDSKDIFYFLSVMFLGLILSEAVLAKRNLIESK